MIDLVNKEKENYADKRQRGRLFDQAKRVTWKKKSRHIV